MLKRLDQRAESKEEMYQRANEQATQALFILAALIILMILGILFYNLIASSRLKMIEAQKEPVTENCSEYLGEILALSNESLYLKAQVVALENALNEDERIIEALKKKLNVTEVVIPNNYSRVTEKQMWVYPDKVVINIEKAFPVAIADSKSMYPFINKNAKIIEVRPANAKSLKVGDIVGYKSEVFNISIIHRIIEIGSDDQGWYALTKGDSNDHVDPEKVRFSQVSGVLVGIIY